jgi:hypothetical protein
LLEEKIGFKKELSKMTGARQHCDWASAMGKMDRNAGLVWEEET